MTCDFQQCGNSTSVDSDEPVQPPVKLRNSKQKSVSSFDVAHSIGVQNVVLPLICLQEPIFNVLVLFFVLKLGVYVCLVRRFINS